MSPARRQRRAHVLDRVEGEPGQPEQRTEDAQHLPRGTGLAQRLHDAVPRLRAALAIDERAGGFRERADRQQHVGVLRAMPERRHHHDEFGLLERAARRDRIRAVELGLRAQHEIGLARIGEHRPGVEPARSAAARRRRNRRRCSRPPSGNRAARRRCRRAPAPAPGAGTLPRAARRNSRAGSPCARRTASSRRSPRQRRPARCRRARPAPACLHPAPRRRRSRPAPAAAARAPRRTNARGGSGSRPRPNAAARSPRPCDPPGAAAARPAGGPCAGSCPRRALDPARRDRRSACRARGCPRPARHRGNPTAAAENRRCPSRARA